MYHISNKLEQAIEGLASNLNTKLDEKNGLAQSCVHHQRATYESGGIGGEGTSHGRSKALPKGCDSVSRNRLARTVEDARVCPSGCRLETRFEDLDWACEPGSALEPKKKASIMDLHRGEWR